MGTSTVIHSIYNLRLPYDFANTQNFSSALLKRNIDAGLS